jgi:hypothetical protein
MEELFPYIVGGGAAAVSLLVGLVVRMASKREGGEGSSPSPSKASFAPAPLVRHLLNQRWVVGSQSGGLWSFDFDEGKNRGVESADEAKLTEIYEDKALYGYVSTHFMRFGKDTWSFEEPRAEVHVQLYWDQIETEPKVELQFGHRPDDSTPDGMVPFETGMPSFDQLFPARFANRATVERLMAGRDRLAYIDEFAATWGRFIREIEVTDTLEAKLDLGALTWGEPVQALDALLHAFDRLASTIETAIDPSYVKAPPPDETIDRHVRVQVLTQCIRCKAGLPLNGPIKNVECTNCLSSLELSSDFWDLLRDADKQYRKGQGGYQRNFTTDFRWRVQKPQCGKCEAELPVSEIPVGTEGAIHCVACGAPSSTFPAPAWLRQVVPNALQVFGAERDREDGQGVVLQPEDKPAPVAMACPQCNGGLTITAEMERTIKCQYCQTDVFLPDALWKRLHPVKIATPWFVRLAPRT